MSTLIVSSTNTIDQKCRCCLKPAINYFKLVSLISTYDIMEKTYHQILNEIIKLDIPPNKEHILPQQICEECCLQLINSYKFIKQASDVAQQYLRLEAELKAQYELKSLQETLIDLQEISTVENQECQEFKEEHVSIDCNVEVKEESEDNSSEVLDNVKEEDSSTDEISEPESIKNCDLSDLACDICHKVYRNEKNLKIHKRYTHMSDEDKIPCPLCTFKANRYPVLKHHMSLTHGPDKVSEYLKTAQDKKTAKYKCNLCSQSYASKYTLHKHIHKKHNKKPPAEEESENDKTSPKVEKSKEKERFLCTYCGKSYSFKNSLKNHVRTHTGERPYSCEICNKSFYRFMGLQMHRVVHSDEKPYTCSECGKGFKLANKLKFHMRVHSEVRPYKCNECGKAFKYACVLKSHMFVHTGETPFPCKTCGESFALRTSLNYHCSKNGHEK